MSRNVSAGKRPFSSNGMRRKCRHPLQMSRLQQQRSVCRVNLYLVLIGTALRLQHNAFAVQKLASCLGQASSISRSLWSKSQRRLSPDLITQHRTDEINALNIHPSSLGDICIHWDRSVTLAITHGGHSWLH